MSRYFLSFVALFSLSCSSVELPNISEDLRPDSPLQITARTYTNTRGAIVEEELDMGSFGVYCAQTGAEEWSSSAKFSKFFNQRYYISKGGEWLIDGGSAEWGYNSISDNYTFFAYSPYSADTHGVTPHIEAGQLVLDYEVPTSSLDQPDLLYAEPRLDVTPLDSECVSLKFVHVLACVGFEVVSTDNVTIEEIEISGVACSGSLGWNLVDGVMQWSDVETSDLVFSVDVENYNLDKNNSAQLNSDTGYLMMIPQTLTNGAKVIVTLSNMEQKSLLIPSNTEWVAGVKYNYIIKLEDEECDFLFTSSQISNCYIINPTKGDETVIQIPIEERINDFWVNYKESGRRKIKSKDTTDEFSVSLIWDDFSVSPNFTYNFLYDSDSNMVVRLYVPADAQEGNLLFAVVKSDESGVEILWSWHLWFTDYNPDAIASANRANIKIGEVKEYDLTGYSGEVHRYMDVGKGDAVWSDMYSDKFIMDRNIGSRNATSGGNGAGSVYYQFGRKDPFPGSGAIYYSTGNSEPSKRGSSGYDFYQSVWFVADYFISGTSAAENWCGETIIKDAQFLWYDPDIPISGYSEGKSIFDPSPLGWRIPVIETWSCFDSSNYSKKDDLVPPSVTDYYPYYGYREGIGTGSLICGDIGFVWSATQLDSTLSYCFSYSNDTADSDATQYIPFGLPIRAIEE